MITAKVEALKPLIVSEITNFCKNTKEKSRANSTSRHYEDICTKIINDILKKNLPEVNLIMTPRSEYPEIRFQYQDKKYAIDIKTAKNENSPAFDLCYISTFELERFNDYEEEWILSVAYDGFKDIHESFVDCHFNKLHNLVNKTKEGLISCGGHAVKVRPITWSCIRNEEFKIDSREYLLELIKNTYQEKNKIDKYKSVMDKQILNFNKPKRNSFTDFIDEESFVVYMFNKLPHLDFKKVRKIIKEKVC
jgi:hypothetical protein